MRLALVTPLLLSLAAPALVEAAPPSGGKKVLPFLENDYGTALKEARSRKLPLFIEAWAPW